MPGSTNNIVQVMPDAVAQVIYAALANARARGEPWQALAVEFLETTELALRRIETLRREMLRSHAAPAREMSEMNEALLALLERLADAVWLERGQSPQDPFISILSPGTPNFFFDWPVGRPADRIEVLLDLLAYDDASWSPESDVGAIKSEIRALIPKFRTLNEVVISFRGRLEMLEKSFEVIARIGHVQYARLRRRMRADGIDAFEVRQVFPDLPGASTTGTLA